MRVFVFEYMSGGGCVDAPMVASLIMEGDMMLSAAVRDMLSVSGVEVIICRDHRLDLPAMPIEVVWVDRDWRAGWEAGLEWADVVLPIAPESDGILEALCREVEASGKCLLNSCAEAVALAASKQATIDRLAAHGVPVVHSWRADRLPPLNMHTMVIKPDRGMGCQDIHLAAGAQAVGDFLAQRTPLSDWLVQPYVEGKSASLSLLVDHRRVCVLGCNLQRVAQVDDGFLLLGCVVNGLTGSRPVLVELAQELCLAMPGLWGYVGVDLIMTENGPVVLEVNPRLTTSYVGLSRSTGLNIAELMLRLAEEPDRLPDRQWCGKSVHVDLELGRVA